MGNWRRMMERAGWKVNKDGVMGGMEIWKDADTKEHWEKCVIRRDFF